jgi:hypothetical protein
MHVAITNYDTWAAQEWGASPPFSHPDFCKEINLYEKRRKYNKCDY